MANRRETANTERENLVSRENGKHVEWAERESGWKVSNSPVRSLAHQFNSRRSDKNRAVQFSWSTRRERSHKYNCRRGRIKDSGLFAYMAICLATKGLIQQCVPHALWLWNKAGTGELWPNYCEFEFACCHLTFLAVQLHLNPGETIATTQLQK